MAVVVQVVLLEMLRSLNRVSSVTLKESRLSTLLLGATEASGTRLSRMAAALVLFVHTTKMKSKKRVGRLPN